MKQLTRNFLHLSCPACGDSCQIQTDTELEEQGKAAIAICRNHLRCGYKGTVKITYGPMLAAKNPGQPEAEGGPQAREALRNFIRILCPHCTGVCRVRTSVQVIAAQRTAYVFCQDEDECGYRGVVFLTHDTRLVADPNGRVRSIPLAPEAAAAVQQDMEFTFIKHDKSNNEER
ncbi:MAG: ogr/Delta-like zinc finger family protein [Pseudohongiella sp.]|uniref:ogr/Delta-like zinc finger family protein n=1 Tax=Pseudohongiella sp. TaxID=1979412 RepID=UPI00349FFEDF